MTMPVKREKTFTIPLKDVCEGLGFKYELDMYDDVYYDTSLDDLKVPDCGKYNKLKNIFPYIILHALESQGRSAWLQAIEESRNKDIVSSLEKISVEGEYTGTLSNGEDIEVHCPARVNSVEVDMTEDCVRINIQNPEHLLNDVINGIGEFYPKEIMADVASDNDVLSRFHYLFRYFEVYGESIDSNQRIEPANFDEEFLLSEIFENLNNLSIDEIWGAVIKLDNPQEGIDTLGEFKDVFNEKILREAVMNINEELEKKKIKF